MEHFVASPLHSVLIISYEMLLRCLEQVRTYARGSFFSRVLSLLKLNAFVSAPGAESGFRARRLRRGPQIEEQQHQDVFGPQRPELRPQGHPHRCWPKIPKSPSKKKTAPPPRVFNLNCLDFEGTPVQNDLQEFYAIIEFVNPGILGSSAAYRKVYEEPVLRSRQPSCAEVRLRIRSAVTSLSVFSKSSAFFPAGGAALRRRASGGALPSDRRVHPETDAGGHRPLPAPPPGLDAVLRAFSSAAGAVPASPQPQGLQILPSGRRSDPHTPGLHHGPEEAVQPPGSALLHRPGPGSCLSSPKMAVCVDIWWFCANCASGCLRRNEQVAVRRKPLSMRVWPSSSHNPTLQVNSGLRTLGSSWSFQTC